MQLLSLGQDGVEMILNGEFQGSFLHNLKVLNLRCLIELDEFLYEILQKVPNIEKLVVCDSSFKEIFCGSPNNVDYSGLLLQLKVLYLESLGELISIGLENSWIEPFLGNLETLQVIGCSSLINLVACRVSLSNLTYLKVERCCSLQYLLKSSTVKSLAQLKTMEIIRCDSIEEIVSKEGEESDEDEIIFPQLSCLKLQYLRKLTRFYQGSLSFPSLKEVCIIDCYLMVTLCAGTVKTDKLFQVKLKEYSNAIPLEVDLKSTMWDEFLSEATQQYNLKFIDRSDLEEIWRVSLKIPNLCFRKLQMLIVDGCKFLSDVLPFTLLPLLPKLGTLEVRNCDSVKTIFDVKCTTPYKLITFPLKKLVLSNLTNLETVWNEDPLGILCMKHLHEVSVEYCKCLTNVFPSSVAKDLVHLKNLAVKHCEGLMAIVAEDTPADPQRTNEDGEIIFEQLQVLHLKELDELRCFYPDNVTLSFPSLEKVYVINCDSMKTFSPFNKIDHSAKWYSAEDAAPRQESDLNSALCRIIEKKAADEDIVRTFEFFEFRY